LLSDVAISAVRQRRRTFLLVLTLSSMKGLANYRENTGFKGPIYVDSTRKLYFTLGMDIQTMATAPSGQKPSYVTEGFLSNAWKSMKVGSPVR
jgi:hypothetical protein